MTRNVELCIADEQTYVGFEMLTEMQNLSILSPIRLTKSGEIAAWQTRRVQPVRVKCADDISDIEKRVAKQQHSVLI